MVTTTITTYKAEMFCMKRNRSFEFTLLNNKQEEINITQEVIKNLPEKVYGKMLTNTTGYNVEGWFEYVNVKKSDLSFINKIDK